MRIELVTTGRGGWTVRYERGNGQPDLLQDELCWDEALGVVASILLGKEPHYLRTQMEVYEWRLKYGLPLNPDCVALMAIQK